MALNEINPKQIRISIRTPLNYNCGTEHTKLDLCFSPQVSTHMKVHFN